jgi:D-alanyl-D-alanine dipeptidase
MASDGLVLPSPLARPYYAMAIVECHEPLVPIASDRVYLASPHPYQQVGAPYGDKSPFYLRQSVLQRFYQAQQYLQQRYPGWQLYVFDAFRPIAVQAYMVKLAFQEAALARNLDLSTLSESQLQELAEVVYQFWAPPSADPTTPPPHSTGAAIDVTLVDATGQLVNMGSPIDELSPRSHPHHFAESDDPVLQQCHQYRQLLFNCMTSNGFARHPSEWWHFSYGDQLWAWQTNQMTESAEAIACYGRAD